MKLSKEQAILLSACMLCIAATVFAGAVWYGNRHKVSDSPTSSLQAAALPYMYPHGLITAVGSNFITAQPALPDGSIATSSQPIKIFFDSSTEIYVPGKLKDVDLYQKEVAEYQRELSTNTAPIFSPDPFEHTTMTPADLQTGMYAAAVLEPGASATTPALQIQIQIITPQ